jgi:hypothetical protein
MSLDRPKPARRVTAERRSLWFFRTVQFGETPDLAAAAYPSGATLGSVEEAGERLAVCALEAGAGSQTKIHGVADGAVWIIEQMEAQFWNPSQVCSRFLSSVRLPGGGRRGHRRK